MSEMINPLKVKKKGKDSYRHGDLKLGLAAAALKIIQRKGTVDFSIREIATATGVSHAAAYKHFNSKMDLVLFLATLGFEQLSSQFRKVLEENPCDLVGIGQSYVRFAVENPGFFNVMFHPELKEHCLSLKDSSGVGFETYQMLQQCIEENKRRGQFVDEPTEQMALAAWSMVHGMSSLWVNGSLEKMNLAPNVMSDHIAVAVANQLMKGLLKRE